MSGGAPAPLPIPLPPGRDDPAALPAQADRVARALSLSLLADFPVALLVLNGRRQIIYGNDRALELMGNDHPDPIGLRPGEAFSCVHSREGADGCGTGPICRYCGAARSLAASLAGLTSAEECSIERSRVEHLEQLDVMVWSKPVLLDGERFLLFAVVDVSERRRRESLERIFMHDLMNTAGSLSSIMRLIDPAAATFPEYFGLARGAAEQLIDELSSHRLLLEAESGELPADFSEVDGGEVCAAVAELYRRLAEANGTTIASAGEGPPPTLRTDPVLLRRVLSNLVKNAIEASGEGDAVTLGWSRGERYVDFSVSNPAVMPEEVRAQVFRRSFSTKGRGRGLGTYAARLFAEGFLKGSLRLDSGPGRGTTFTVRLPLDPSGGPVP